MQIPAVPLFQDAHRHELLPRASCAAVRHDHEPLIPTRTDKSQFQRGAV
jgi:hypothetical protein